MHMQRRRGAGGWPTTPMAQGSEAPVSGEAQKQEGGIDMGRTYLSDHLDRIEECREE